MAPDGRTQLTLWAGTYEGQTGLPPPPNSYGSDPNSDLAIFFIQIPAGGSIDIPPAQFSETNRVAYFVEGSSLAVNGSFFILRCCNLHS